MLHGSVSSEAQYTWRIGQKVSIRRPKRWPPELPTQHGQFVGEHDDLEFLELSRPKP
jgi:hypothetical protein